MTSLSRNERLALRQTVAGPLARAQPAQHRHPAAGALIPERHVGDQIHPVGLGILASHGAFSSVSLPSSSGDARRPRQSQPAGRRGHSERHGRQPSRVSEASPLGPPPLGPTPLGPTSWGATDLTALGRTLRPPLSRHVVEGGRKSLECERQPGANRGTMGGERIQWGLGPWLGMESALLNNCPSCFLFFVFRVF